MNEIEMSPEAQALIDSAPGWATPWLEHPIIGPLIGVLTLVSAALLLHLLTQRLILRAIEVLLRRTASNWDDLLFEHGVFRRLAWLIPVMLIHTGTPLIPLLSPELVDLVQRLARSWMVLIMVLSLSSTLSAINAIYGQFEVARGRPIKGFVQALGIVLWMIGLILIVSTMAQQSPWYFLSGIGAMTAILLLIFRDTLLGLVAGVQLSSNGLVQVGDWIEMPQFSADGDVIDISLHHVKVQNWDKTVSVIPTHKFLENSFKNWRNMVEIGGRRIKRSIFLDLTSIRFLDADEIERFSRFNVLTDYIHSKREEITEWNSKNAGDGKVIANARHLTNVGTLRAYLVGYLRRHPQIHQEMTFLVRQLQPTAQGLPLEVYVFTNDTRWPVYEGIQSDVFDHVLAILPEFGLRVFQDPSGNDFAKLGDHLDATARLPKQSTPPSAPSADGRPTEPEHEPEQKVASS